MDITIHHLSVCISFQTRNSNISIKMLWFLCIFRYIEAHRNQRIAQNAIGTGDSAQWNEMWWFHACCMIYINICVEKWKRRDRRPIHKHTRAHTLTRSHADTQQERQPTKHSCAAAAAVIDIPNNIYHISTPCLFSVCM